jgi:hypothetical protein
LLLGDSIPAIGDAQSFGIRRRCSHDYTAVGFDRLDSVLDNFEQNLLKMADIVSLLIQLFLITSAGNSLSIFSNLFFVYPDNCILTSVPSGKC